MPKPPGPKLHNHLQNNLHQDHNQHLNSTDNRHSHSSNHEHQQHSQHHPQHRYSNHHRKHQQQNHQTHPHPKSYTHHHQQHNNRGQHHESLQQTRRSLPIWHHADSIRNSLRTHAALVLVGETGCGKSTQVPQFLLGEDWCTGCIAVTQPRRVAAVSLAARVADEMGVRLRGNGRGRQRNKKVNGTRGRGGNGKEEEEGVSSDSNDDHEGSLNGISNGDSNRNHEEESSIGNGHASAGLVGYSVRFDSCVSQDTRIKYVTEGMLLQEMLRDRDLERYSAVLVDEVHERSVNVDVLLAFLIRLVAVRNRAGSEGKRRNPLKLVVMSATAEAERLVAYLEDGLVAAEAAAAALKEGNEGVGRKEIGEESQLKEKNKKIEIEVEAESRMDVDPASETGSEKSWSGFSSSEDEGVDNDGDWVMVNGTSSHDSAQDRRDVVMTNGADYASPKDSDLGSINGHYDTTTPTKHPSSSFTNGIKPHPEKADADVEKVAFLAIKGRQFPVSTLYLPEPTLNFVEAALKSIFTIHTKEPLPGDILCFLTGQDMIESLEHLVNQYAQSMGTELPKILVLPLFAALSQPSQQLIFRPTPPMTRKVILATNIAETSVTVPGIRHVIDSGKAKFKSYNSRLGFETLLSKPISKSAAIQRKGRAGREAAGKCYRLYTEACFLDFQDSTTPEILRCDLAATLLGLKARGVNDVFNFPLLDAPPRQAIAEALLQLLQIGALDDAGHITVLGQRIAKLPLSPFFGRALVEAASPDADCLDEVVDIVACLAVETILLRPRSEEAEQQAAAARASLFRRAGDHLTLLAILQAFQAERPSGRRSWCESRFISYRAMQHVLDVRKQLRSLLGLAAGTDGHHHQPEPEHVPDATATGNSNGNGPNSSSAINSSATTTTVTTITETKIRAIMRCLIHGFTAQTAVLVPDGSYRTSVGRQTVAIHPSSTLFGRRAEAIVFTELVFTTKTYARWVSAVELAWVEEVLVGWDFGA